MYSFRIRFSSRFLRQLSISGFLVGSNSLLVYIKKTEITDVYHSALYIIAGNITKLFSRQCYDQLYSGIH